MNSSVIINGHLADQIHYKKHFLSMYQKEEGRERAKELNLQVSIIEEFTSFLLVLELVKTYWICKFHDN